MRSSAKFQIILAIIAICVCITILASTSLALFTVPAKPIAVRVQAGTLDVDLAQADNNGYYVSLENEPGNIFGEDEWEPGQTRVYFFKVKNKGDVPLKFTFVLLAQMDEMAGALEYTVFEDQQYENVKDNADYYRNAQYVDIVEDDNSISGPQFVSMRANQVKYYAVAVRMKPESDNKYQNKACYIDVYLEAVQNNA